MALATKTFSVINILDFDGKVGSYCSPNVQFGTISFFLIELTWIINPSLYEMTVHPARHAHAGQKILRRNSTECSWWLKVYTLLWLRHRQQISWHPNLTEKLQEKKKIRNLKSRWNWQKKTSKVDKFNTIVRTYPLTMCVQLPCTQGLLRQPSACDWQWGWW